MRPRYAVSFLSEHAGPRTLIGCPCAIYTPAHWPTLDTTTVGSGEVRIDIEPGGLLADSGIALEAMGDKNRDMIIAVACVTVGY